MLCGGSMLLAAVVSFHSQGNQITQQQHSILLMALKRRCAHVANGGVSLQTLLLLPPAGCSATCRSEVS